MIASETQMEVSMRLTTELERCRLEAESVEILSIFWMATQMGYQPPTDLASAVTHPCWLAALLLKEMGLELYGGPNPHLQIAPEDFEIPVKFELIQGTDVPRLYLSRLRFLETKTRLPLVRQCAYEWSVTAKAYPDAPYQGYLSYFVRPIGDGAIGSFSARSMLRLLSAYCRTLDVARIFWGLPEGQFQQLTLEAAPIEPTLAFLRPERPHWLPPLRQQVAIDDSTLRDLIARASKSLAADQPESTLLAVVTPIFVDRDEVVELSIVKWRQWGKADIDAYALGSRFSNRMDRWEYGVCSTQSWGQQTRLLPQTLTAVIDVETNSAPLASVYGFSRIAYLQRELYPLRLFYPVLTGLIEDITVEPSAGSLKFATSHGQLATLTYWNAGWNAAHPSETGALCGTALVGDLSKAQVNGEPAPDRHFYLWKVTRLKRPSDHGRLEKEERSGCVFIE